MKQFLLIAVAMLLLFPALAQPPAPQDPPTKTFYLQKSRNQRTTGWVLLGTGAVMLGIAAPGNVSLDFAPVLVIGGGAAVIGSVPFFLAAGRNKRKAAALQAGLRVVPVPSRSPSFARRIPSAVLTLSL